MSAVPSSSSAQFQSYKEVPSVVSDLDGDSLDSDSEFEPLENKVRHLIAATALKKNEMIQERRKRVLDDFAENDGDSGYQVVAVSNKVEHPSKKRYIVHRTLSGTNEVISTAEAIANRSLNNGVTSSVHPVENGPETSIDDEEKYVYRFAGLEEDSKYSRDYLNEMQILTEIDQLNKKYVGLRPLAHCIVLHPELGVGCLDKRFKQNLVEFINQSNSQERNYRDFITFQLLQGLGTLLELDVIHTDLKSDNILVETILGGVFAYHGDFGKALFAPKGFKGSVENLVEDVKMIVDKIDEAPFPGGNTLDVEIELSEALADKISDLNSLRKIEPLYLQLHDLVQKRMLFSMGCVLYELYTEESIDPSKEPDDLLTLDSIIGKDFYSRLKVKNCPEIFINLIVELLKPFNQRISVDAFIHEVNSLRLMSDEVFLPAPIELRASKCSQGKYLRS